jgi:succinate dehydrogenase/fumarate reductase flavoprotein subunit
MSDTPDFDLLVLGGGMAGMSAAAEAALRGASVMVCEIADHLGGTAVLSSGNVWTVRTAEAFLQSDPDGDVALWQVVRDTLDDSLAWVESMGVPVRERHKGSSSSTYDPPPIGRNVDIETLMARARRAVESAGGVVLNGATISKLAVSEARVTGGRIRTIATGDEHAVSARGVVLASGGFQASRALRARFLGDVVADSVAIRSNPHSAGGGLTLALDAGARLTPRMDTFYGVVLPAVPGEITEGDYRSLVLHGAVYGLVLGPDGDRLVDESVGAVPLANAIAKVGRALFVVSDAMAHAADDTLGMDLAQILKASGERGSRFAMATSIAGVAAVADAWGYDGNGVRDSLSGYDAAVGSDGPLEPPRRRHRLPLGGDLLVVEVQSAVTSTFGGVRTDEHGQAQTDAGTPISGLFAAGVDQGGYNVSGYVGGLSRALTFGRRTAARALGAS